MNRLRNWIACVAPALCLLAGSARAEVSVWSDGFETNKPDRWEASGAWKIGSPTAGPAVNSSGFRTHSGTNCAYTQGYAYNQDGRLVCTRYNGTNSLLVPPADQLPRLRFWHWFKFANALGYVEISTNKGVSWIQISPTYRNINGGGVWSRPSIDLSAYAGDAVWIAFHFTSGGCCGNALGWFVDDVAVDVGPSVLNLPEGFESDPKTNNWCEDFGTWEIGHPTSGPDAAHTGTNCAGTVLAGNYSNLVDTRLISPPFVVPDSAGITLTFWQWYSFNNALGFVEVNNGTAINTSVTNTTITTNSVGTLNTNIYQLFGALNTDYSTPLYWNPTIGGWTNSTKAMGNVFDTLALQYLFEAGSAPLVDIDQEVADYTASIIPMPQTADATNFLAWQGLTWTSPSDEEDTPVGYFGTNTTVTYTTNTVITVTSSSWTQLSPTYVNGSTRGWINTALDLSTYAGQAVQIAFHFTSGGIDTAPGWYVDDINLAAPPQLTLGTNQVTVPYGQEFTNYLSATNPIELNSKFVFALAAATTNVVVTTNGQAIWKGTNAPPGTYMVYVQVTDNNTPPFRVTNDFAVTVDPLPSQLVLTNLAFTTNGGHGRDFKFSIKTPWTTNPWLLMATTNLSVPAGNWVPLYTNQTTPNGILLFTDRLATNYPQRYYRAVFQ